MMVVLPAPLCPTRMVSGAWNSMTFSADGLNDRIPTIFSFSIDDMAGARRDPGPCPMSLRKARCPCCVPG